MIQVNHLGDTVVQVNLLVVTVVPAQPMCPRPVQYTLGTVLVPLVLVQSTLHTEHPAQHTRDMEVGRLLQLNLVLEDQILTSEVDPVQPCPVKVIPWEGQVLLIPVLEDLAQHIQEWEDQEVLSRCMHLTWVVLLVWVVAILAWVEDPLVWVVVLLLWEVGTQYTHLTNQ